MGHNASHRNVILEYYLDFFFFSDALVVGVQVVVVSFWEVATLCTYTGHYPAIELVVFSTLLLLVQLWLIVLV